MVMFLSVNHRTHTYLCLTCTDVGSHRDLVMMFDGHDVER